MLRSEKGITLVALVVTIVVLIILATISISVAINGNIIGRAQFKDKDVNTAKYIDQYISNATYVAPETNATPETPDTP